MEHSKIAKVPTYFVHFSCFVSVIKGVMFIGKTSPSCNSHDLSQSRIIPIFSPFSNSLHGIPLLLEDVHVNREGFLFFRCPASKQDTLVVSI